MRARVVDDQLSVQAIAGTYVILLGINLEKPSRRRGLLGFAIERTDHTSGTREWIPGFKTFESPEPQPTPATLTSTVTNPIQAFHWGDYAAQSGREYTYRVVPMYGRPGALTQGDGVEVRVKTESESAGKHAIYFNRGAAASQAYVRRFQNRKPDEVGDAAYRWLSRGLEEAMLRFIGKASGRGWGLRAAVYEFSYPPVLEALRNAARAGADVHIVYDCKQGEGKPGAKNEAAIRAAGLHRRHVTARKANNSFIAHNKFIVLLKGDQPVEVWTGSTNVTEGGIFGHSNVGHIVRDRRVAAAYLAYWDELRRDPNAQSLRRWNVAGSPVPDGDGARPIGAVFSPRDGLEALQFYARLMDGATSSVFLTAAFGINKLLRKVLARDKPYLRYLLLEKEDKDDPDEPDIQVYKRDRENLVSVGSQLTPNILEQWVLERFREEELTGANKHVKYIHTKYMLVDPLGEHPIVVTGSANFSDASTLKNDENMLVIRDDPRVADVYLGEFMRLYSHYRFRWIADQLSRRERPPKKAHLCEDDAWLAPYFQAGSVKSQERLLFA
jgi:phosphatidylserine/phosphatidylglycerophosphate/cardiolipin synthase-like enzyme